MPLIAWYRFNDSLADSTTNGRTLTVNGTTTYSAGKIDKALSLNGSSYAFNSSYELPDTNHFTMSVWVKTSSTPATEVGIIAFGYYPVTVLMTNGKARTWWYTGSTYPQVVSTGAVNDGLWHHVATTYDGSNVRLYVDGALNATTASTTVVAHSGLFLGREFNNGDKLLTGDLDDARFYDECLSAREIYELSRARVMHLRLSDPSEVGTTNLFGTTPLTLGVYAYATGPVSTASIPDANLGPRTVSRFTISSAVNTARANIITAVTAGKTYTLSYWIKYNGTNTFSPTFTADASKGSPEGGGGNTLTGTTTSFTYYANGWYRARYTFTVSATPTGNAQLNHGISTGTDSAFVGNTFDTYDYQFEEAPEPSQYAQLTRATAVQDSTGYGNTGTTSTAASTPSYVASTGKIGPGLLRFDGADDTLVFSSLNSGATVWTLNLWVKYTYQSKAFEFLIGNSATTGNIGKILLSRNGNVSYSYPASTYNNFSRTSSSISGVDTMLTFAATGTRVKLYVNGAFDSEVTVASTPLEITTLGNAWSDSVWQTKFDLYRASLYSTELTATEISALYTARASIDSLGNLHAADFDQVEDSRFSTQYNAVNLIENGSAQLGSTYNFTAGSTPTYSTADSYDGDGKSFTRASSATILSNEYVRVNRFDTYRLVGALRSIGAGGLSTTYFGLACYDKDKNFIEHVMSVHPSNTRTTLAQQLNNGDTTVYLTSSANWVVGTAGQTAYNKWIGFYTGTDYPPYTYTRTVARYVTVGTNTLTLQSAWSGGTVAAGTPVANNLEGSTFNYLYYNASLPSTWTVATNTITGYATTGSDTAFRYGTEFVRVLMLLNYAQASTYETRFDAIQLYNTSTFQPYRAPQGPTSTGVFEAMEVSEIGPYRNLQAYYPLDYNASDYSGNAYHGTVEVATLTSGVRGGAYNFTAGSLITANNALTGVFSNQRYSWGAWINRSGASYRILMSSTNRLELNISGGVPQISMNGSDGWTSVSATTTTVTGTWYHVFATYAEGTARLYVNGELEGTLSKADFGDCGVNLYIGNWSSKTQDFLGKIDDVRVYSRALSADEVRVLYDSTRPASTIPVKMTGQDIFAAGEFNENEI